MLKLSGLIADTITVLVLIFTLRMNQSKIILLVGVFLFYNHVNVNN